MRQYGLHSCTFMKHYTPGHNATCSSTPATTKARIHPALASQRGGAINQDSCGKITHTLRAERPNDSSEPR